MSLSSKGKRPSRLEDPANVPHAPSLSPVEKGSKQSSSGRFLLSFGRRKDSTATNTTGTGSFSTNDGSGTFALHGKMDDKEDFEFSVNNGTVEQTSALPINKSLPIPSGRHVSNSVSSEKDHPPPRLEKSGSFTRFLPRMSALGAASAPTSPSGANGVTAPIYVGKESLNEDLPPVKLDGSKGGMHYKQSYKSRHKVPEVFRKLHNDEPEYEWPSEPAYAREAAFDHIEMPPPPEFPEDLEENEY